ncbi:hypothetical protein NBRC116594_26530 [Shimia sp. NS0008-38b]|uniref:hypothetical protein n=1 Tax=Shimia sp. NS0008-38b TaxID=3127653 RepID=UPI0031057436
MKIVKWATTAVAMTLTATVALADDISLKLPEHSMSAYMQALLTQSLEAAGHTANIEIAEGVPARRFDAQVSQGEDGMVTFKLWRRTLDNAVIVPVDLTGGLIGKRVFFIRPSDQAAFSEMASLGDLQGSGMVGGFGKGWYDVSVWNENALTVSEVDGEWRNIYKMLGAGNRGIDYFSRGIMEIEAEAPQHPDLAAESDLLFVYPGDFQLFMSPAETDTAPVIQAALEAAVDSGLRDALVREFFPSIFDPNGLNMDGRTHIELAPPAS